MALSPIHVEELEKMLAEHEVFDHLRVKERGDSLTMASGDAGDPALTPGSRTLGGGSGA